MVREAVGLMVCIHRMSTWSEHVGVLQMLFDFFAQISALMWWHAVNSSFHQNYFLTKGSVFVRLCGMPERLPGQPNTKVQFVHEHTPPTLTLLVLFSSPLSCKWTESYCDALETSIGRSRSAPDTTTANKDFSLQCDGLSMNHLSTF